MSLKAFHIVFILAADALAIGMVLWASQQNKSMTWIVAGSVCSTALTAYLAWFIRKSKDFKKP